MSYHRFNKSINKSKNASYNIHTSESNSVINNRTNYVTNYKSNVTSFNRQRLAIVPEYDAAIVHMEKQFEFVKKESMYESISETESIAATFGNREQGYARMASFPHDVFLRLFPDAELECFASPLDSHLKKFCSLGGLDRIFGSLGNFFDYTITERVICANPPNEPDIITQFIKHISSQKRDYDLKVYLFTTFWDTIHSMIGPSMQYCVGEEIFTRQMITDGKMMTNGNPNKFGESWTPQKDKILLTFIFPKFVNRDFVVQYAKSKPYWEMNSWERLQYQVERIIGVGSELSISIYNKLLFEYSFRQYSIESKIVGSTSYDMPNSNRLELNEFISYHIPNLLNFGSLSSDEMESVLLQCITICLGFKFIDGSDDVLFAFVHAYNQWCDFNDSQISCDLLFDLWYPFSNQVVIHWLDAVCPLLRFLEPPFNTVTIDNEDYTILKFRTQTDDEYFTNTSFTSEERSFFDGSIGKYQIYNFTRSYECCLLFCNSTPSDLHRASLLMKMYTSGEFCSKRLCIVSFEQGLISHFDDIDDVCVTSVGTFLGFKAYFSMLIFDDCLDRYMNRGNSRELPSDYVSIIRNSGLMYASKFDTIIDHQVEAMLYMSTSNWDEHRSFYFLENCLIKVVERLRPRGEDDRNMINPPDSLMVASGYLLQFFKHALKHADVLNSILQMSEKYPLVDNCGGVGSVDLYCNDNVHNTNTLMFMIEYVNSNIPFEFGEFLSMDMLGRRQVVIGKKLDSPYQFPIYNYYNNNPKIKFNIVVYEWTYKTTQFVTYDANQTRKNITHVYFYKEKINYSLQVIFQLIEFTLNKKRYIEYHDSTDPTEVITIEVDFENAGKNGETIIGEFRHVSRGFYNPDYEPFPNVKIPNVVNHDTRLGVQVKPILDMFRYPFRDMEYDSEMLEQLTGFLHDMEHANVMFSKESDNDYPYHRDVRFSKVPWKYGRCNNFGNLARVLNHQLYKVRFCGFRVSAVNAVPLYYFTVLKDLSRSELTLAGNPVDFHLARIKPPTWTTNGVSSTLFTCQRSNIVWNSKIGQILSTACSKSLHYHYSKLPRSFFKCRCFSHCVCKNITGTPRIVRSGRIITDTSDVGFERSLPTALYLPSHVDSNGHEYDIAEDGYDSDGALYSYDTSGFHGRWRFE